MPPSVSQRSALLVSVVDARGGRRPAPGLAAWLARVAPRAAIGEVTVALVSDLRVRALNRRYRARDTATDVLSFPSGLRTPGSGLRGRSPQSGVRSPKPDAFLGDIVIARGVAKRQAREAGHAESTEWRVLALHGLLHLIGYDHETDSGTMARVEARLRRSGGLPSGLIERRRRR